MLKKCFPKGLADGIFQCVVFQFVGSLYISSFALTIPFEIFLVLAFISVVLPGVIYFFVLRNEHSNKSVIQISAISALSFVLLELIITFFLGSLFNPILPDRDVGNAEGIFLLFYAGGFLIMTLIIKLCIFISAVVKNKKRNKNTQKTEDVLLSGEQ